MPVAKLRPKTYRELLETVSVSVPEHYNFAFDFLDAEAAADPTRPAMIHIDNDGNRRDFDLAFFSRESARMANAFKDAGLKKGDRVMVILYRRLEWWVTMLALHKLGAVPVPSPNLLTPHDIDFRVNYAGIKAIIAEDSVVSRVEDARPTCPTLSVLVHVGEAPMPAGWLDYETIRAAASDVFPRTADAPGGKDTLLIFFSSGTTGMPKMVEHTHGYALGHMPTGVYWHNLEPGDVHLTVADTGWGKAVWGKFYGQWMAGATVFVWDFRGKFHPAELLEIMSKHKVTTFCAPPTVYRFLIREDLKKYDLSALRYCTTAGELLNDGVFRAWKEITGLPIHEGYGQTETCLQIATFPCMEPKPGSIGRPAPGWNVTLLDEEGHVCPPGVEGEICIGLEDDKNVGLFAGYLLEPAKTASVMIDGYYHTGDKAWMDEDGYYWFLGRTDDLIKSSGYRIGPFEVESALITHPAVVEAAVTGVPDPVRGQAVKATVVLAPEFDPSDELAKELQNHVKKETAPYKYPRVIDFVDELPKTISGKIKRAEIRARDANREI
ncbi:AMP-dependent synthetase and ligase [Solidesulfovibrio fructosivorans JJ]]|uniref:AMP-dependent synthetase and ligase n=1 Tax=Solidesulfovibrio fructosivorans JJ] TaxID=596151 RepID=E1JUI9_SOLFR|nr:AMP-binding protein [Solidesulfovibrio fructosivorans]EFL52119.1 AMP-dependent synthetase and ligase [Solidesulfovibrio fructosivorans JJ]]